MWLWLFLLVICTAIGISCWWDYYQANQQLKRMIKESADDLKWYLDHMPKTEPRKIPPIPFPPVRKKPKLTYIRGGKDKK